ncbi:MAG: hypothetical protein M5U08_01270 [Burkholderiales bacterium]|nr:hypothetical protein [Burkholderiales bacterium]
MRTEVDDACPYEWAEFNLPQALVARDPVSTPLARRAALARRAREAAGDAAARPALSGLRLLLPPDFGLTGLPKP